MREHLKQLNVENSMNCIQKIISEGVEFYTVLYHKFNENYLSNEMKMACKNDTPPNSVSQRAHQKMDLIARVTAQKLLICLGDLWRYKIRDLQGQDYAEAVKYYKQAQALAPSNGVPYNQLAVVAIHNVSIIRLYNWTFF